MEMKTCSVCSQPMREVFRSSSDVSITSLAVLVPGQTVVFVCERCGHMETPALFDLEQYYDTDYKIGALGADDDDLYSIENGRMVFRSEHMARVMIEKTAGFNIGKLLDYGCGKSLTSKRAMASNPGLDVYLFDVSRDYEEFWKDFRPEDRYAFFTPPPEWVGLFDCVTSFFSLEHVPSPRESLEQIRQLLKNGGLLYAIVPNIYSVNRADMLVVDHLHHYSLSSMKYCLSACGFELLEVDNHSHQQASIYLASATVGAPADIPVNSEEVASSVRDAQRIAAYWQGVEERLYLFEVRVIESGVSRVFIYGAGIVGIYLYSRFRNKKLIAGFIDSNSYKQKKRYCELPVIPPGEVRLGENDGLLVGLNAGVGEAVIGNMRQFDATKNNTFFC